MEGVDSPFPFITDVVGRLAGHSVVLRPTSQPLVFVVDWGSRLSNLFESTSVEC